MMPPLLQAQKKWTLQDCIDYALSHNLQVKQQQLTEKLASVNLWQSKAELFPNLGAYASHSYNYGKTIDMYTNTFATSTVVSENFYLSSSITLFSGFQLLNSVRQNRIKLDASKYDLDKMMNDISLNIATAFLQILYNNEILANAQDQAKVTKLEVDRMQKIVDAGSSAKGPLLDLQAQQANEDLAVVNARNSLDLSLLSLAQMLDLDTTEGFDIAIPVLSLPTESALLTRPDAIYALALGVQPEIKSAELNVKSALLGLTIAHGMRSPILSLRGSLGTGYSGASQKLKDTTSIIVPIGVTSSGEAVYGHYWSYTYEKTPFEEQIKDNINKTLSFSLTIPIFNNWQTNTAISRSKIAITSAEYSLQTAKNTLYKSIQQAYADATAALNKYNSSQKSVTAMTEAFKYAQQKFDVGSMNTTDYNTAKTNLSAAESNLLQAKYEYVFRLKVLDFYMGKPIELK